MPDSTSSILDMSHLHSAFHHLDCRDLQWPVPDSKLFSALYANKYLKIFLRLLDFTNKYLDFRFQTVGSRIVSKEEKSLIIYRLVD